MAAGLGGHGQDAYPEAGSRCAEYCDCAYEEPGRRADLYFYDDVQEGGVGARLSAVASVTGEGM